MSATATTVTRAQLIVYDAGQGETPKLGARQGAPISLGLNPKEVTWARSANWDGGKGGKTPQVPEFKGPVAGTLSFEAFLSEPDTPDVTKAIEALFTCVAAQPGGAQSKNPRPPFVQLHWGAFWSEVCVVKSVSAKVTVFTAGGKPVRATAQLQLQEVPIPRPPQNPTSGGIAGRRVHVMVAGDTLASVAFAEYDDASRWRDLAIVNRIEDPMRVLPGTRVLVPALDEAGGR